MSNVVPLLPQERRPGGPDRDDPIAALAGIAGRVTRIGEMQFATKDDMQQAILLLGLSNLHARRLIGEIADPETRSRLIAQSVRIDDLVETARQKAAAL